MISKDLIIVTRQGFHGSQMGKQVNMPYLMFLLISQVCIKLF